MDQLVKDWDTKMNTYINRLTDFQTERRTHCVGTTMTGTTLELNPEAGVIECP